MASGDAIDEQYRNVWAIYDTKNATREQERIAVNQVTQSPDPGQESDNYDPNEVVVQQSMNGQLEVVTGSLKPPLVDSDEDEEVHNY